MSARFEIRLGIQFSGEFSVSPQHLLCRTAQTESLDVCIQWTNANGRVLRPFRRPLTLWSHNKNKCQVALGVLVGVALSCSWLEQERVRPFTFSAKWVRGSLDGRVHIQKGVVRSRLLPLLFPSCVSGYKEREIEIVQLHLQRGKGRERWEKYRLSFTAAAWHDDFMQQQKERARNGPDSTGGDFLFSSLRT